VGKFGTERVAHMMRTHKLAIKDVYVPVKRRSTLNPKTVHDIAESILEVGLKCPILVRQDGERFVLVEGLHRLEACKQLGEETILGYFVQARQH
jgi:sulfiredoxin